MKKKLSMQVQESASIEERFQQFLSASAATGLSDKTLKTYQTHFLCIAKHLDTTTPLISLTKSDTENMNYLYAKIRSSRKLHQQLYPGVQVVFGTVQRRGIHVYIYPVLQAKGHGERGPQ